MNSTLAQALEWMKSDGLKALIIIVLAIIFAKTVNFMIRRVFQVIINRKNDVEYEKKARTLKSLLRYTIDISVIIIASMMVLRHLGVDIKPILAGAGVAGLAIGFGARRLVEDIIGGFFIFLEDQIRVNDIVEIAGKTGVVEKVNLRMTILRDLAGNVHFVRNGNIDIVTNMTKGYSRYVFEVGVAYREDTDEVTQVLSDIGTDLAGDPAFGASIVEPLEILGVDKFADSAVIIKARIQTKPGDQWKVGREFNRRMKKKFDEMGIEIPFPHLTLYQGIDKDENAPPLRVKQDNDK